MYFLPWLHIFLCYSVLSVIGLVGLIWASYSLQIVRPCRARSLCGLHKGQSLLLSLAAVPCQKSATVAVSFGASGNRWQLPLQQTTIKSSCMFLTLPSLRSICFILFFFSEAAFSLFQFLWISWLFWLLRLVFPQLVSFWLLLAFAVFGLRQAENTVPCEDVSNFDISYFAAGAGQGRAWGGVVQ